MSLDHCPVRLKPVFFTHLWGGTLLRDVLGKDIQYPNTGESWEVSTHPKGSSIIMDGPAAGMTLSEYIGCMGKEFYGEELPERGFPLLIKFIGPRDTLSIQVHPDDTYAYRDSGESGKSEAWVVIDAPKGARLVYGVDCDRDTLAMAIRNGTLKDHLSWLPVSRGDIVNIPPGCIHALTEGVVVYEIQQSSDTTYRLYDWDRVDQQTGKARDLHVRQALDVMDPVPVDRRPVKGLTITGTEITRNICICNDYFALERLNVHGQSADWPVNRFATYSLADGSLEIRCQDSDRSFTVKKGDTFIVPANGMPWRMKGQATVLKGWVPGRALLAECLRREGISADRFAAIAGMEDYATIP